MDGRCASAILAIALLAATAVAGESAAQTSYGRLALDDLSGSKVGSFPRKWRTWPLQRGDAEKVYKVAEEGGQRFILAHDEWDLSEQIFLNFNWEIEKRPMLSWSWRATTLPKGGMESSGATNDSACGLYVVIGRYKGHAIKYVWSTKLPLGKVVTRRDGKLKIKVLDSGPSKAGSWVSHKVDVAKDYEELFGKKLDKNPSGIGLLTDGNALHVPSGCDYRGFAISGDGV